MQCFTFQSHSDFRTGFNTSLVFIEQRESPFALLMNESRNFSELSLYLRLSEYFLQILNIGSFGHKHYFSEFTIQSDSIN